MNKPKVVKKVVQTLGGLTDAPVTPTKDEAEVVTPGDWRTVTGVEPVSVPAEESTEQLNSAEEESSGSDGSRQSTDEDVGDIVEEDAPNSEELHSDAIENSVVKEPSPVQQNVEQVTLRDKTQVSHNDVIQLVVKGILPKDLTTEMVLGRAHSLFQASQRLSPEEVVAEHFSNPIQLTTFGAIVNDQLRPYLPLIEWTDADLRSICSGELEKEIDSQEKLSELSKEISRRYNVPLCQAELETFAIFMTSTPPRTQPMNRAIIENRLSVYTATAKMTDGNDVTINDKLFRHMSDTIARVLNLDATVFDDAFAALSNWFTTYSESIASENRVLAGAERFSGRDRRAHLAVTDVIVLMCNCSTPALRKRTIGSYNWDRLANAHPTGVEKVRAYYSKYSQ